MLQAHGSFVASLRADCLQHVVAFFGAETRRSAFVQAFVCLTEFYTTAIASGASKHRSHCCIPVPNTTLVTP
jgi:hypothetical protein